MKNHSAFLLAICLACLSLFACKEASKTTTTESSTTEAEATRKPFIKGTYFEGANGVFFDKNDQLHVASVTGRQIGVVDTKTGEIIKKYSPAEGVDGPDDLTIGPDGSIYHTNLLHRPIEDVDHKHH